MTGIPKDSCEFCQGKVERWIIQVRFPFRGKTIYIDKVPVWVCAKCGEQYFDAPVYERLEAIAKVRGRIKRRISFPLAKYDMALP